MFTMSFTFTQHYAFKFLAHQKPSAKQKCLEGTSMLLYAMHL